MNTRYLLYAVYLVTYALGIFLPALRNTLLLYALLALIVICLDFTFRLKNSTYIFFPVIMGLSTLLAIAYDPYRLGILKDIVYLVDLLALACVLFWRARVVMQSGNASLPSFMWLLALSLIVFILFNLSIPLFFKDELLSRLVKSVNIVLCLVRLGIAGFAFARYVFRQQYISEKEVFTLVSIDAVTAVMVLAEPIITH